jgi:hypothetical protein
MADSLIKDDQQSNWQMDISEIRLTSHNNRAPQPLRPVPRDNDKPKPRRELSQGYSFLAGGSSDTAKLFKLLDTHKPNQICRGFSFGNCSTNNCRRDHICAFCDSEGHGALFTTCPKRGTFPSA